MRLPDAGVRVRVQDFGEGAPLVIVPGNTGDGFPFIPLLSLIRGRRILVVNRPGGGLSDGMDHRAVDIRALAVETLETVLDAFEVTSAPILAHSMGGHWAHWFALDRPDRVSGLALLGVPGNVLDTCPPLLLRLAGVPGVGALLMRAVSPSSPTNALDGLRATGQSSESLRGQPAGLAACYFAFDHLPHYAVSTISLMQVMNRLRGSRPQHRITEPDLHRIHQPYLLAWGTDDPFGSLATGRQIAHTVSQGRFVAIEGAGHLPWLDAPQQCADLIADFLDEITRSP